MPIGPRPNRVPLIIAVVAVALFMEAVTYGLIVPVVPSYAYSLGASDLEVGIIFATYPAAQMVSMMPIGILSDRYGRSRFIVLGLVAMAASTLAFAMSTEKWELVLTRGLQGLASSCTMTAGLALVSEKAASGSMGGSLGIVTATQGGGYVAGPVMGGLLMEWGGYALPFLVTTTVVIAVAVFAYFALRSVDEEGRGRIAPSRGLPWRKLFRDRTVLSAVLVIVAWAVGFGFLEPAYAVYLPERFAANAVMVGVFFAAVSIPYAFSQPLFGRLSDRIGRKWPMIVSSIVYAMLFSLLVVPDDFVATTGVGALMGLSQGILFATSLPLLISALGRIEQGTEGMATGLYNTCFAVGIVAGLMAFGLFIGTLGLANLSLIYSALVAVSAIAAAFLAVEHKRSN
ncbi:MFS transporter [Methanomassiliicoccus luminyensis]|jgi:DHA1 family solute carrier family 18 vesicular amine transporter 1/2|uniref:MFS transporter n=1 Tax=Methanomassiliicoccus luminyensis TaxID=1080712 RepID=UPI0003747D8B|nr:MFS transporter [Methanomassiliicoccus luminyensis]